MVAVNDELRSMLLSPMGQTHIAHCHRIMFPVPADALIHSYRLYPPFPYVYDVPLHATLGLGGHDLFAARAAVFAAGMLLLLFFGIR